VRERTTELSAFVRSGIVEHLPELEPAVSAGGATINMPYWETLTGEDQVIPAKGALKTTGLTAGQDVAVRMVRANAWAHHLLAKLLSGSDPAAALGAMVAEWWVQRDQALVFALLRGVFATAEMQSLIHDIAGKEGNAATINGVTVLDAKQRLGDASDLLTGIAMHSKTFTNLQQQNLINYVPASDGKTQIAKYLNKYDVIVDDGMPVEGAAGSETFTTYLFGRGAVGHAEGEIDRGVETERRALESEDVLIHRRNMVYHIRGISWKPSGTGGFTPSSEKPTPGNDALEKAANWKRVYPVKNIRVVKFTHKLGDMVPHLYRGVSVMSQPTAPAAG
jgi:hypothetical protein